MLDSKKSDTTFRSHIEQVIVYYTWWYFAAYDKFYTNWIAV